MFRGLAVALALVIGMLALQGCQAAKPSTQPQLQDSDQALEGLDAATAIVSRALAGTSVLFEALMDTVAASPVPRASRGRCTRPQLQLSVDSPTVLQGRMHVTDEWVLPMTTEFGRDERSDFRIEGAPLHVQGDVLVVVDPIGGATPESLSNDVAALAKSAASDRVILMSNVQFTPVQFGQWFGGIRAKGLRCEPQSLHGLTFNVLTTTNVLLEFHDRLDLAYVN